MTTLSNAARRALVVATLVLLLVTISVGRGGGPAFACDCTRPDPVDAIAWADVVFTGEVLGNEGTEWEPVWRFRAEGVVKGDLDDATDNEVVVVGENWFGGCGTDFGADGRTVVVYALRTDHGLRAMSCVSPINPATLEHHLERAVSSTGTGPPAAVLVGIVGLSDVAVLDDRGRILGRVDVGVRHGVAAHCAGTTLAAIVTWDDRSGAVRIIDLADLSVVDQRSIDGGSVPVHDARVVCLDGGDRVVAVSGFGPIDEPSPSPRATLRTSAWPMRRSHSTA